MLTLRRNKPEGPHSSVLWVPGTGGPLSRLPGHLLPFFTVINLADQQFTDPAGIKIPKVVPTGLHQVWTLLPPLAKKGGR